MMLYFTSGPKNYVKLIRPLDTVQDTLDFFYQQLLLCGWRIEAITTEYGGLRGYQLLSNPLPTDEGFKDEDQIRVKFKYDGTKYVWGGGSNSRDRIIVNFSLLNGIGSSFTYYLAAKLAYTGVFQPTNFYVFIDDILESDVAYNNCIMGGKLTNTRKGFWSLAPNVWSSFRSTLYPHCMFCCSDGTTLWSSTSDNNPILLTIRGASLGTNLANTFVGEKHPVMLPTMLFDTPGSGKATIRGFIPDAVVLCGAMARGFKVIGSYLFYNLTYNNKYGSLLVCVGTVPIGLGEAY